MITRIPSPPLPRAGLSLLEVLVALLIFTLIIGTTLGSVSGVRQFVDQKNLDNDLVLEGRKLIDEIVNDLGNSAWFIPGDADGDGILRPPDGNDLDDLIKLSDTTIPTPPNPPADRTLRYYPYVLVQSNDGLPPSHQFFAGFRRPPDQVPDPANYPSGVPKSHKLSSREVVFLKIRTGATAATPSRVQNENISFGVRPATVAEFKAARTAPSGGGVAISALGVKPNGTRLDDTPLDWETDLTAPVLPPLSWSQLADRPRLANADYAREYTYAVVPEPNTGKGRLERRFRNQRIGYDAARAAEVDHVMSRNVDRIVVDTYRTASDLNVNQVRIALYLSHEREDQPGVFATHRAEVTIALRSTVDPEYALNLKDILAGRGVGGTFRSGVFTPE